MPEHTTPEEQVAGMFLAAALQREADAAGITETLARYGLRVEPGAAADPELHQRVIDLVQRLERAEADAAGVGRISAADREAGDQVGELLTECVWAGMGATGAEIARSVAKLALATGSGFGLALAEWLERWAGEEGG